MLLKFGDSGFNVRCLQQGLRIMCCNPGTIDAEFGPGTTAAVEKFQNDQGIDVDGIVGDETWNCLLEEIKPIQRALKEKGYYSGAITGIAKATTYEAVLEFQSACQLAVDGMVGTSTRERLFDDSIEGEEDAMFPLTIGSRGDYVLNLQYGLRILCCSPGVMDGIFGSGTAAAVEKFQTKYSLSVTGVVNSETWYKHKELIRAIQQQLDEKGYPIARIDGLATSALSESIKSFQEDNWLKADGQVGPATEDILFSDMESGATDALPLKVGSRGPQVLYFQYALQINCINPNGTDGIFGNGMASAVNRYKTGKGLTADGMVDTETWETMRDDIRPLQVALSGHGYEITSIDGIATDEVYEAILQFQRDNNLAADGMVGTSTKALLLGGSNGEGTVSSTLKLGSNGSLTRYLQRMLRKLGYDVEIDGIFGKACYDAVLDFQQKHNLDADGIVGGGTWKELFNEYHVDVTLGDGIEKLVNVAKYELEQGFREDNANNITPYGQWYGMNGQPWCAMFVSFCAYQAGVLETLVPRYSWCPSGMTWYKNKNRYHKANSGYVPKVGDIIFFYNNELGRVAHTGIVIGGDKSYVTTIEGNTTLDAVEVRTYNRNHITIDGYGDNGGKPIFENEPPTEQEKKEALLSYFKEFLVSLNLVNPSVELELNKEIELVSNSYEKIIVEASESRTIYDNIENNPIVASFDIVDGNAMTGQVNIGDYLSVALEGIDSEGDTKKLEDFLLDLNMTIDNGSSLVGIGTRAEEDGVWFYIEYGIKTKVKIKEGFPPAESVFKFTYCIRDDSGGDKPFYEELLIYLEEHKTELAMVGVGTICVLAIVAGIYTGAIAGGVAALVMFFKTLILNLANLVFA